MLLFLSPITANSLHKLYVVAGLLTPFRCVMLINWLFKDVWLHSFAIKIFNFTNITNINLQLADSVMILHFKIIPITMSICIRITSYKAIILIRFNPYCKIKIPTLEIRIKSILARLYKILIIEILINIFDFLLFCLFISSLFY